MNPSDDLAYPAVLTPWVIHLAKAENVEGLVRLSTVADAVLREVQRERGHRVNPSSSTARASAARPAPGMA